MDEYVDLVVRGYKPHIENIYQVYSGMKTGRQSCMSIEEFETFCLASGILNDLFTNREIPLVFSLSTMTYVDNVERSRHLEASLLEFMEMVCRGAEQASFPPPSTEDDDFEMSIKERQKQPLYIKLMNCLPRIFKICCQKRFMMNNPIPEIEFPPEDY